ncbi:hypothetical protein NE237_023857 [Protea cynaroides]|uniref:SHSP domain-containing protein n=1 Tax=Protea cynaroides TaxID=273540 RepID=A0A9Q0K6T8_9MAGN|nr:hypothetical protein NE237_023857 [Protea cynaroides]
MSSRKQLEVRTEDLNPQKWRVSLTEDMFESLNPKHSPTLLKVFGDGSLFSPLLFGRFFDPSDAFPLWEFESEILLSALRSSGSKSTVDWSETATEYVLKAELPGVGTYNNQVCVENGKIMEISGQWKQQQLRESNTRDWRSGHWWEYGYVRRLELPEYADWRKMEAIVYDDMILEIRIPKIPSKFDIPQASENSTSHE